MKKLIIIFAVVAMTACGIYKPYSRPDTVQTDGLYGSAETPDSTTLGDISWQELFTDPDLQALINEGLENNTDLQAAQWRVKEAQARLKAARLSYLPSFNFAPTGSISSFDGSTPTTKTYSIPITASWQLDIFAGLTNAKRNAKALYAQSIEYRQAVQTQLIANIANLYYTLEMLDSQYAVTLSTTQNWEQSVKTMRALKQAGLTNEAGVAQYEATWYGLQASLHDLEYQINSTQNSLCSLLGCAPDQLMRGQLDTAWLPHEFMIGVPVQMLDNRPDVRASEDALMQSYYATAAARSALYPQITLSGSVGWTNNAGSTIVNPGKLLWSVAGSLLEPIFNANANRARVNIAKAQQQESLLSFQQTLLNAGEEVNNALTQYQGAYAKTDLRIQQIDALQRAVQSTQALMQDGTTTYLDVLTAQQSLLSAQLTQISDQFDEIQGVINLYQALGGGRDMEQK